MKRLIIILSIAIVFLLGTSFVALHSWIGHQAKQNIALAQQKYPGSAEDALIAFLQDETNSYNDRTHKAIWTLGQIRSEKALPILQNYYQNNPKGESCKGKHDLMLCQYELYKAIKAINGKVPFSHARLNK